MSGVKKIKGVSLMSVVNNFSQASLIAFTFFAVPFAPGFSKHYYEKVFLGMAVGYTFLHSIRGPGVVGSWSSSDALCSDTQSLPTSTLAS